jgi:hypothetical protein
MPGKHTLIYRSFTSKADRCRKRVVGVGVGAVTHVLTSNLQTEKRWARKHRSRMPCLFTMRLQFVLQFELARGGAGRDDEVEEVADGQL